MLGELGFSFFPEIDFFSGDMEETVCKVYRTKFGVGLLTNTKGTRHCNKPQFVEFLGPFSLR